MGQTTLNQLLKHIGISDLLKATKEEIRERIYNRYFKGDNKDSDLYQFVKDVLDSQNNDFNLIRQNIDVFQWFSLIFGINSSVLTTHLIAAESRFKHQPDQLILKANADTGKKDSQNNPIERRNDLNKEEKEVLEFVGEGKEIKTQTQTKKEEETQKQQEPIIEIDPNSPETIKKAAERFIQRLRNPDESTPLGKEAKKLIYFDNGFCDDFLDPVTKRYNLPYITVDGEIVNGIPHQMLLLKPPYQDNGKWKILVYDPYQGKREIELDEFDEQKSLFFTRKIDPRAQERLTKGKIFFIGNKIKVCGKNWTIWFNKPAVDYLISGSQYDFSNASPNIISLKLQQDMINCVGYTNFMGILLNAYRTDLSPKEIEGLRWFEEDFGIKIIPENISYKDWKNN